MNGAGGGALATLAGLAVLLGSSPGLASNPLEYPDNGSASFSRGGAWLAVANEPIATHYNPAGLAIQGSGFSIEQQLNFQHICYDRRDAHGNEETANETAPNLTYLPVCNQRNSFPSTIPSISIAFRVSRKLGLGIAVVPPAAYGSPDTGFPELTQGTNQDIAKCLAGGGAPDRCGGSTATQLVPAPYRYQQLNQLTTLLFPTIGAGYEVAPKLRVGAAFISGIAVINASTAGMQTDAPGTPLDHPSNDSLSTLHTKDLFVPGAILAVHWSPLPELDVAAWGRWLSAVESTEGDLTVIADPYEKGRLGARQPLCRQADLMACSSATSPVNRYGNETFRHFELPYPPELRAGVRYHRLRTLAGSRGDLGPADPLPRRDPLHEDVFDVELDGSYTFNEAANTIQIRFAEINGAGLAKVLPLGKVPPNADKWNGWQNSVGARLGGQVTLLPDKLGVRAGTWIETQSQDPRWLTIAMVPSFRGGFGGGIVFRQDSIDISIGYQMHWAQGLDNHGQGAMRAVAGFASTTAEFKEFNVNPCPQPTTGCEPPGVSAADRTQFRSQHFINDGRVTQSAHAFTLGGTMRF